MKLIDDESVREKITVMSKLEAMWDDERNPNPSEKIEELLKFGKSYRIVIEEID